MVSQGSLKPGMTGEGCSFSPGLMARRVGLPGTPVLRVTHSLDIRDDDSNWSVLKAHDLKPFNLRGAAVRDGSHVISVCGVKATKVRGSDFVGNWKKTVRDSAEGGRGEQGG